MGAEARAKEQGIESTDDADEAYLNMIVRIGNILHTSGNVSEIKGKLGDDLNIDQLEQTMLVSAVIHSLDTEYEALGVVATINGVFSECLALDTECSVYS